MMNIPDSLPTEIVYANELRDLDRACSSYRLVVVRGAPLSGKATLLDQFQRFQDSGDHLVSRNSASAQELGEFLVALFESQGVPFEKMESNPEERLDLFFGIFKESFTGKTLVFSNFDRVKKNELLLNFILREKIDLCLMISISTGLKIDPLFGMDAFYLEKKGFTEKQVRQFLENSQVAFDRSQIDPLARALFLKTKGNPFVLKLSLATLLVAEKELVESQLDEVVTDSEERYIQSIVPELPKEDLNTLLRASLLNVYEKLEKSYLETLSGRTVRFLVDAGLALKTVDGLFLEKSFKKTFLKSLDPNKVQEVREELFEKISFSTGFDSLMECCYQEAALGKGEKYILEYASQIRKRIRHDDFLRLSESSTTPEIVVARADVYFLRVEVVLARKELAKLRLDDLSLDVKTKYLQVLSMVEITSPSGLEIREWIQSTLSEVEPHSENYFILYSRLCAHSESKWAIEHMRKILDAHAEYRYSLELKQNVLVFLSSRLLEELRYVEAVTPAEESNQICERLGLGANSVPVLSDLAAGYFGTGRFKEYRAAARLAKERAEKFGRVQLITWASAAEGWYQFYNGFPSKALQVGQEILSNFSPGEIGSLNLLGVRLTMHAYLYQGNFEAYTQGNQQFRDSPRAFHRHSKSIFTLVSSVLQSDQTEAAIQALVQSYFESDKHPEMFKLLSQIELFRVEDQLFFSVQVAPEFDQYSDLVKETFLYQVERLFYASLRELFLEKTLSAEKGFQRALEVARRTEQKQYIFKSLVFLSLIFLKRGEMQAALKMLNEAHGLLGSFEFMTEEDLFWLLKALVSQSLAQIKNQKEAIEQIGKTEGASIYSKVAKTYFSGVSVDLRELSAIEKAFLLKFNRLLPTGRVSTVQVRTRQGKKSISFEKKRVKTKKGQIFVDLLSRDLRVGQKKVDLFKKNQLLNLFLYFLRHPKESFSKEHLTTYVWHEIYSPEVHDPRVYVSVQRLRNLFKDELGHAVIETEGPNYRLNSKTIFELVEPEEREDRLDAQSRWILNFIKENKKASRLDIQSALKVSQTSAKNYLKNLVDRELIEAQGAGKATFYVLKT